MVLFRNNAVFLVTSLVIFNCVSNVISGEGSCTTTDGKQGTLIPILKCEKTLRFLDEVWTFSAEEHEPELVFDLLNGRCNILNVCYPHTTADNSDSVCDDDNVDKNDGSGDADIEARAEGTSSPVVSNSVSVSNYRNYNLLPIDCGYLPLGDRIINGEDAELSEFPWMARLAYGSGNPFRCAGTVITDAWILTAAHCLNVSGLSVIGVRVGEYNTLTEIDCVVDVNGDTKCSEPVQDLIVEQVIAHPGFNLTLLKDDIALVKVSKMNISVANVQPICLPLTGDEEFSNGIVTGWGRLASDLGTSDFMISKRSTILQKVTLPVVPLKDCQNVYKNISNINITDKQICAGGQDNKDSCTGDSGGPLQIASYVNSDIRYVQEGILSFGPTQCGRKNVPGIYTKVAAYMDWIVATITP